MSTNKTESEIIDEIVGQRYSWSFDDMVHVEDDNGHYCKINGEYVYVHVVMTVIRKTLEHDIGKFKQALDSLIP